MKYFLSHSSNFNVECKASGAKIWFNEVSTMNNNKPEIPEHNEENPTIS